MVRRALQSRWSAVVGTAIVTATLTGGTVALAGGPRSSASDVYHVCVSNAGRVRTGTMRLDVVPTSCPQATDAVHSWNAEGPPGPGSVVRVDTGAGLTGGPITDTGAISVGDGGITTAMLTQNAVTAHANISGESGATTNSTTPVAMPGARVTLDTTGGPVLAIFSGSHHADVPGITGYFRLVRDGTVVLAFNNQDFVTPQWTTTTLFGFDTPSAGTHTYEMEWYVSQQPGASLTASAGVYKQNMLAIELKR